MFNANNNMNHQINNTMQKITSILLFLLSARCMTASRHHLSLQQPEGGDDGQ
jgi:hypothetical protein